jgi:hypothetical protein
VLSVSKLLGFTTPAIDTLYDVLEDVSHAKLESLPIYHIQEQSVDLTSIQFIFQFHEVIEVLTGSQDI